MANYSGYVGIGGYVIMPLKESYNALIGTLNLLMKGQALEKLAFAFRKDFSRS